jgi:hypothetical protein
MDDNPIRIAHWGRTNAKSRAQTCSVGFDDLAIPMRGVFKSPLLRFEVVMDQAEAVLESFGPLEVVYEGPLKISPYIRTLADRFMQGA